MRIAYGATMVRGIWNKTAGTLTQITAAIEHAGHGRVTSGIHGLPVSDKLIKAGLQLGPVYGFCLSPDNHAKPLWHPQCCSQFTYRRRIITAARNRNR